MSCRSVAKPTGNIEDYIGTKLGDVQRACESKYGPMEHSEWTGTVYVFVVKAGFGPINYLENLCMCCMLVVKN